MRIMFHTISTLWALKEASINCGDFFSNPFHLNINIQCSELQLPHSTWDTQPISKLALKLLLLKWQSTGILNLFFNKSDLLTHSHTTIPYTILTHVRLIKVRVWLQILGHHWCIITMVTVVGVKFILGHISQVRVWI